MIRRSFMRCAAGAAFASRATSCRPRSTAQPDAGDLLVLEGEAFNTSVTLTIALPPSLDADGLARAAESEIARLDAIFSLAEPRSPLRRLNDTGSLDDPPAELVEVLRLCGRVHRLTGGAFDPTVQPLWELYERHFALHPDDAHGPPRTEIEATRALVGFERVTVDAGRIAFARPGMALTLNGVAPGFAADRTAAWLSDRGVDHALVNLGEFRAVGSRPGGDPWQVEIRAGDAVVGAVALDGDAVATSSGSATTFTPDGKFHHLFDPRRDRFGDARRTVSVQAPTAALADALATAAGVMPVGELRRAARDLAQVEIREFSG